MCYELRCSYLHSGNNDINDFGIQEDDVFIYKYNFELCVMGTDSIQKVWSESERINNKIVKNLLVRIEVIELCKKICIAAEKYYQSKGEAYFKDSHVKILNIEKQWKKINDINKKV